MAKLRGTEAEIYARLRELTEGFRQVRRELGSSTAKRVSVKSATVRAFERPRAAQSARKPR